LNSFDVYVVSFSDEFLSLSSRKAIETYVFGLIEGSNILSDYSTVIFVTYGQGRYIAEGILYDLYLNNYKWKALRAIVEVAGHAQGKVDNDWDRPVPTFFRTREARHHLYPRIFCLNARKNPDGSDSSDVQRSALCDESSGFDEYTIEQLGNVAGLEDDKYKWFRRQVSEVENWEAIE
jgi:hypothetical protein